MTTDLTKVLPLKWAISIGNQSDGFSFEGPFNDPEAAAEYGDRVYPGDTWWLIELVQPTNE